MRERILAILGAVALIVAAVVVRSLLAGGDETGDGSGRGDGERPVVACTRDLMTVCDALAASGAITAASGPLDLSGAGTPDSSIRGWITWDPAPQVINFDRPDTWLDAGEVLAGGTIGVLSSATVEGCADGATWASCVLAAVNQGRAVGVGPGTTAQSLVRLHPVAGALVPDDGDFTTISAGELRRVVTSPAIAQADQGAQLTTFLTRRGALDLVVGTDAALRDASSRQQTARVTRPEPVETAAVVLVTRNQGGSGGRGRLGADLVLDVKGARDALEALGLSTGEGTTSDTVRAGEFYAVLDKLR